MFHVYKNGICISGVFDSIFTDDPKTAYEYMMKRFRRNHYFNYTLHPDWAKYYSLKNSFYRIDMGKSYEQAVTAIADEDGSVDCTEKTECNRHEVAPKYKNYTDIEQTEHLLRLGVPANSADCYINPQGFIIVRQSKQQVRADFFDKHQRMKPCWSGTQLARIYIACSGKIMGYQIKAYPTNAFHEMYHSLIQALEYRIFNLDNIGELYGYDVVENGEDEEDDDFYDPLDHPDRERHLRCDDHPNDHFGE